MTFRSTYTTPFDQYTSREGEAFEVRGVITLPDEEHDAEVLPMFLILFSDGTAIEAWPEEVLENEISGLGEHMIADHGSDLLLVYAASPEGIRTVHGAIYPECALAQAEAS